MKNSQFNGFIQDSEDVVVYNVLTKGSIRFRNTNINSVRDFLNNTEKKELFDMGFISDDNEIVATKENYKKIKIDTMNPMVNIVTTYNCNCKCSYCFECVEGKRQDGREIDKVVEYLDGWYKDCKTTAPLIINYFGGEPLLNVDIITEIHDSLSARGVSLSEIVTTNGTLLSDATVKKLSERDIFGYQITIDGPRNIHDFRRPMKSGASSFDKIIENVNRMIIEDRNAAKMSIKIRINIDEENVEFLTELFSQIPTKVKEADNIEFYISPVLGKKYDSYKEMLDVKSNNTLRAWEIIRSNNLPISIDLPRFSPCSFNSEKTAFYIDLSGNIYSCGSNVGDFSTIEGKYGDRNKLFEKRINREIKNDCFKCRFFYECMGGCNFEERINQNNCQFPYFEKIYEDYYKNIELR